jgi:hypothetical protein
VLDGEIVCLDRYGKAQCLSQLWGTPNCSRVAEGSAQRKSA